MNNPSTPDSTGLCSKCGFTGENNQPPDPLPDEKAWRVPFECPSCGNHWTEIVKDPDA